MKDYRHLSGFDAKLQSIIIAFQSSLKLRTWRCNPLRIFLLIRNREKKKVLDCVIAGLSPPVILNPSLVILSVAKNFLFLLRVNSVKNLAFLSG